VTTTKGMTLVKTFVTNTIIGSTNHRSRTSKDFLAYITDEVVFLPNLQDSHPCLNFRSSSIFSSFSIRVLQLKKLGYFIRQPSQTQKSALFSQFPLQLKILWHSRQMKYFLFPIFIAFLSTSREIR